MKLTGQKNLILFLFVLLCFPSLTQSSKDSLLDVISNTNNKIDKAASYLELSKFYFETDFGLYIGYNRKAESLLNSLNYSNKEIQNKFPNHDIFDLRYKLNTNLGHHHYFKTDLDSALYYFKKAENISREINSSEKIVNSIINIALIKIEKGDFKNTYSELKSLLNSDLEISLYDEAKIISRISKILYLLEQSENALPYAYRQLNLGYELKDSSMISKSLSNLGVFYLNMNEIDSAEYYINEALNLSIKMNRVNSIIINRANLAELYYRNGHFEKSELLNRESLKLAREKNLRYNLAGCLTDVITYSLINGDFSETETLISEFDSLSPMLKEVECKIWYYQTKKRIAEVKENWSDVMVFNTKIDSVKLFVDNKEINKYIIENELQSQFEIVKENLQTKYKNEVSNQNDNFKFWMFLLITFFTVLLALSVFYYRYRKRLSKSTENQLTFKVQEQSQKLTSLSLRLNQSKEYFKNISTITSKLERGESKIENSLVELKTQLKEGARKDNDWILFQEHFNELNPNFIKEISSKYPELTPHELRLCSLLKLNLSSSEISDLLSITQKSLRNLKYRVHKKMNLPKGQKLSTYLLKS